AFLPMHLTGLFGMPRRIYTYMPGLGWSALNMITTVGAFVLALGIIFLLINVVVSLREGAVAGANPWDAATLEWSTTSPPPAYNFAVIPIVASRLPLWEERLKESERRSSPHEGALLAQGRESLAISAVEGLPELILKMPQDSLAPFVLTVGMTLGFASLLTHQWWLSTVGWLIVAAAIAVWLWPKEQLGQIAEARNG
ncbi:MAG: cytochrome ubiquinol oxidase subunit I, partial [Deltaproteobacteria bacterium]|nr:cytochrome ubiquinol oxidase subunit I [Deltaproteobacteria bacterium]